MSILLEKETRNYVAMENRGQKIFGLLHTPSGGLANTPAVVIVHGFASHKIGTNRSWVHLSNALQAAGIASLRFDQRGFGDSEGDFSEMGIEDGISDIEVALDYVRRLEGINSKKIALFGSSLGGGLAVAAAAQSKAVCAIALWAPVSSGPLWIADWFASNPKLAMMANPEDALKSYRGIPLNKCFQEQFKQLSAVELLATMPHLPLLHMQGESDKVVSLKHQKAYQLARKDALASSTFITYPETDHFLGNERICKEALTKYVEWFREQLL